MKNPPEGGFDLSVYNTRDASARAALQIELLANSNARPVVACVATKGAQALRDQCLTLEDFDITVACEGTGDEVGELFLAQFHLLTN